MNEPMEIRSYRVRFTTPAFLGGADQSGQWRTPPFKHLLRVWWRVAWAARNDPGQWEQMRGAEGRFLGHAWLKDDRDRKGRPVAARRSRVRVRIRPWQPGSMQTMPRTEPAGQRAPASALYLGYGPVRAATQLKMEHPLDAGESAELLLAYPTGGGNGEEEGAALLEEALLLIHAFGALGGRSRNGWGSVELEGEFPAPEGYAVERYFRDWKACLRERWAHAIGRDERGALIWLTPPRKHWKTVIEDLARVRKAVNAEAGGRDRRILNQPVGGKGGRMPSNLRFKVRSVSGGGYRGVVFHMPCMPPERFRFRPDEVERVWRRVHAFLDGRRELQRLAGGR